MLKFLKHLVSDMLTCFDHYVVQGILKINRNAPPPPKKKEKKNETKRIVANCTPASLLTIFEWEVSEHIHTRLHGG